jgi:NADPH:quinone reductase-like Zn-dependent oxidoreductase
MKAYRVHRYGGPDAMQLDDAPVPVALSGQVLLKVKAASVNPIDWKMRSGMLAGMFPLEFPRTLGRDCAGELEGRLVAGVADPRKDGTHAEFALLPEASICEVPKGLEATAAAAVCVTGLSAWIPLVEVAALKKGQHVLIHAGAGGVGGVAIQIARHLGATVTTTSTHADYCRSLGADRVIDYTSEDFASAGPFDVVLDTLGGDAHVRSLGSLKAGGILVALSAAPIPTHTRRDDVRSEKALIQATRERLERIFAWAVEGKIRPQVTQVFDLGEADKAYAAVESGHAHGKVILQP